MPVPADPIARLLALGGELTPPTPGHTRRKFDLAHMRTLLQALGNPHQRFPSVLIAGTNGKGSTAATLASILRAAGHRTGLYTSPHLEHPHERIRINGAPIPHQSLAALVEQVEAAASQLIAAGRLPYSPSFFETVTSIAFLHFAGSGFARAPLQGERTPEPVEIAILEVGLGGRLDATNVVDPILSVITDISLDHQEWLGSTVAAITREKAGILRPGGALVTLPQHPEANQVIGEVAVPLDVEAISATDFLPPRRSPESSSTDRLRSGLRNRYEVQLPPGLFETAVLYVDSPLAGEHQQRNLALAIASALFLRQRRGLTLSREALERGIRETEWPGRLQILHPPAPGAHCAPVLLDAAHNPAGAWALRAALSSLPVGGSRALVFACMADKDADALAQILFPVMDAVYLTRTQSPRAAALDRLAAAAERTGAQHRRFEQAHRALKAAMADTPPEGIVVIAGSVALLGECLAHLPDWR